MSDLATENRKEIERRARIFREIFEESMGPHQKAELPFRGSLPTVLAQLYQRLDGVQEDIENLSRRIAALERAGRP